VTRADGRDRTGLVFSLRASEAPRGAPSWLAPPGDSQVFPVAAPAPVPETEEAPHAKTEGRPSSMGVTPADDVPAPMAPAYPDLRHENEELRRRLAEQARAFASLRTAVLAASEEDLLRLACAVAERAVGRELTAGPDLLRTWVREASDALASAGDVTIVVAPDLAALLGDTVRESLAAIGAVEIDGTVPSMYCELRCGPSTVAASAGARIAAIAADLGVTE
jgi:hypothetical protein